MFDTTTITQLLLMAAPIAAMAALLYAAMSHNSDRRQPLIAPPVAATRALYGPAVQRKFAHNIPVPTATGRAFTANRLGSRATPLNYAPVARPTSRVVPTRALAGLPPARVRYAAVTSSRGAFVRMSASEATEITMPALSSTMTEGKIVQWVKGVGEKVEEGDVVMVVESDKADMDVEAYEAGFIAEIITPEGESAAVGSAVAVLVGSEADVASYTPGGGSGASASPPAAAPAAATHDTAAAPAATPVVDGGDVERIDITMPALSSTMTEGKIVQWIKQPGDKIEAGDAIMVVESDKADMDVEAFEDGFLASIITGEGESAAVGATVAIMAANEADVSALANAGAAPEASNSDAAATSAAPAASAAPTAVPDTPAPAAPVVNEGRVVASGLAKKEAAAANVNLRTVQGTGPNGRITADDVSRAASGAPVPAWTPAPGVIAATPMARALAKQNRVDLATVSGTGNFGRVTEDDVLVHLGMPPKKLPPPPAPAAVAPAAAAPVASASSSAKNDVKASAPEASAPAQSGVVAMDGMQKAIAANMEATLSVPIFRVSRTIVTDPFDALYAKLKPKGVSVSVMLAKAVAQVLEKHPLINASYINGGIQYNESADVAMAVAIDGGLLTPTLKDSSNKDIYTLGREWRDLVGKAKAKKLSGDESRGTFTISNLGMFGVSQFDAILPPGTGSILAIGGSTPVVVQQPNGYFGTVKQMTVTITCDHRHIYGADAAEFLKDLADLLENNVESLVF